jgi:hypothetical protein
MKRHRLVFWIGLSLACVASAADLEAASFSSIGIETNAEQSRSPSPRDVAVAYCPRARRCATRSSRGALQAATDHVAKAIAARGEGEVSGKIQAHVIATTGQPVAAIPVGQFKRVQVWPLQNMPPKAQPCTRNALAPISAMVES